MYASEPGGLWNAGWIVFVDQPLPSRGELPTSLRLSVATTIDEEERAASQDNEDWQTLGRAEFTLGLKIPDKLEQGGNSL